MNKFYFKDIEKYLLKYSVNIISELDKNILFDAIGTLQNANKNDLTFFHNTKYLDDLKNTKAKACFIQDKYIKIFKQYMYPNNSRRSILDLRSFNKLYFTCHSI